ncbi:hypothetical protein ACSSS7_002199 [Eimeria intestinalis]
MPPSAGRLRLLQRLFFTAQLRKGSGPQARASRRLLRKDPGHRAASHTRDADLKALTPYLYAQTPRNAFKRSSGSSSSFLLQKKIVPPLHGGASAAAGSSASLASSSPDFACLASPPSKPSPEGPGGRRKEPPSFHQPRDLLSFSAQATWGKAASQKQTTGAAEDPYVSLALRGAALRGR